MEGVGTEKGRRQVVTCFQTNTVASHMIEGRQCAVEE